VVFEAIAYVLPQNSFFNHVVVICDNYASIKVLPYLFPMQSRRTNKWGFDQLPSLNAPPCSKSKVYDSESLLSPLNFSNLLHAYLNFQPWNRKFDLIPYAARMGVSGAKLDRCILMTKLHAQSHSLVKNSLLFC